MNKMEERMIRCVVSDIDGTLLPAGQRELSADVLRVAQTVCESGRLLAAASGRPYPVLRRLFSSLADSMAMIALNGTLVVYQGEVIYQRQLQRDLAMAMAQEVLEAPECELLISTSERCYIRPKQDSYRQRIIRQLAYPATEFQALEEIQEEMLQISIFRGDGIEKSSEEWIRRWGGQAQVVVSGALWMDITPQGTNKGSALQALMQKKGLAAEEVLALGDSYNDIAMLETAGHSFAVAWAPEAVKVRAKGITQDPVLTIQEVLAL